MAAGKAEVEIVRHRSTYSSHGAAAYLSPGRKSWVSGQVLESSPRGTAETSALVLVAICLLCSAFSFAQKSSGLTGRKSELASPDGRYALRNVDHYDIQQHFVFLEDRRAGTTRKVFEYGRSASAIWSPDSRHFAINDYAGSNIAQTFIFSVENSVPRIDVEEELVHRAGLVLSRGHGYLGVSRWLDSQHVVVHYWGHEDHPPGAEFCTCYIYDLEGAPRKCKRQPRGRDVEESCGALAP